MTWLLVIGLLQAWHQGAPMPTPGYGFACAAVGNRVYTIGGLSDRPDSGEALLWPRMVVEAYDVDGDSWITGFAPPSWPRAFAGCAAFDGKIYVIGGTDGRAETNRVDRFDPATNTWDTVAPLPWSRQGIGACMYQGRIYAVGGYGYGDSLGFYKREVAFFQPDTCPGWWTTVDSLNTPRSGLGVAVAGNRLYAVGGKYYNDLPSAEYYVPNHWKPESLQMCCPRSGLGVVGFEGKVHAIAGECGGRPLSFVEILDVATGCWYEGEGLSLARAFLGVAVVGSRVVALGGTNGRSSVGVVETHMLPFPGIEEEHGTGVEPRPYFPTVVRSRVGIDPGPNGRVEIYGPAGNLVFSRTGPVEKELPQGIYFVRVTARGRTQFTGKLTVLK